MGMKGKEVRIATPCFPMFVPEPCHDELLHYKSPLASKFVVACIRTQLQSRCIPSVEHKDRQRRLTSLSQIASSSSPVISIYPKSASACRIHFQSLHTTTKVTITITITKVTTTKVTTTKVTSCASRKNSTFPSHHRNKQNDQLTCFASRTRSQNFPRSQIELLSTTLLLSVLSTSTSLFRIFTTRIIALFPIIIIIVFSNTPGYTAFSSRQALDHLQVLFPVSLILRPLSKRIKEHQHVHPGLRINIAQAIARLQQHWRRAQ